MLSALGTVSATVVAPARSGAGERVQEQITRINQLVAAAERFAAQHRADPGAYAAWAAEASEGHRMVLRMIVEEASDQRMGGPLPELVVAAGFSKDLIDLLRVSWPIWGFGEFPT
jgi:hypothetical protein